MTRKEKAYEVVQALADNTLVWQETLRWPRSLWTTPEEIREKELKRLLSALRRSNSSKQHLTLGGLSSLTCCGIRQAYFWYFEAPRVPGFSWKVGSSGLLVCRVCGDTDCRTIGYVGINKPPRSVYPPNDDT